MTNKTKIEIIDLLYLIIDINRVGSDETSIIIDSISIIKKKNFTDKDKKKIIKNLMEIIEWSARIGSNEHSIIEEIINLLKK